MVWSQLMKMLDLQSFISCKRGLLIAPAGHGKTTVIADCIKLCPERSCQLVLTHTHAGLASLKNKFKCKNINPSKYHLETITGFAKRYVSAFSDTSTLPDEDNSNYFDVVLERCYTLFCSSVVRNIIEVSFDGIFVDEYQDCTIDQHNMIMMLGSRLPLHLLGDPLQGIFSFEGRPLVSFKDDLSQFTCFNFLDTPWRWKITNPSLGNFISKIRADLLIGKSVNLRNQFQQRVSILIQSADREDRIRNLAKLLRFLKDDSILIIYPSYKDRANGRIELRGGLHERISLKKRVDYSDKFSILDAIDSPHYDRCARMVDSYLSECVYNCQIKKVATLYNIINHFFLKKSEVDKWISKDKNAFKNRIKANASYSLALNVKYSSFEESPNLIHFLDVLSFIVELPGIKCYHRVFYRIMKECCSIAIMNKLSMTESMKLLKSRIRHQGRRIDRYCIGTTLLTKGLEFDTVVIWDAHKFDNPKDFYVAISRARKHLYIMTETDKVTFGAL